ncbi:MAG: hypothetical protein OEZ58_08340, partial [Gammaproteobacteria bacterium]|nr:hypothetical protein [Gammaproteobacteria bacterium]
YMDPDILRQKNVEPRHPRKAVVKDFVLRIGNKATLLRSPGDQAVGMVYSLTHQEIDSLYWGAGLDEYAAEALIVNIGQAQIPVLCCNLIQAPDTTESNAEYEAKLKQAWHDLDLFV